MENTTIRHWLGTAAAVTAASIVTAAGAQTTWHVDAANACPGSGTAGDPFCQIQPAIDVASNNDEILVAPGTYNEAIDFTGKAIHLQSTNGPDATIIDASGLNTSVVTCTSGEGVNTILEGFTITGGNAFNGGGMRNSGSSPTVINCIFTGNNASNSGGGVHNVTFSVPNFEGCTFSNNTASNGGAIFNSGATFCHSHLENSTFCDNSPNDIVGNWADNGGNEFLAECPPEPVDCPADLTGPDGESDGVVDVFDLLKVISEWGPCDDPNDCPADMTGPDDEPDGVVDVFDLLKVISEWGACP